MNKLIEKVDKALDEYLEIKYPEDIFKSMKYTVTLPGKRLRPVMCLEACRIFGGNMDDALPTACAIEMLHAQSLIHDDLPCMDNDDFRRGKPSNHKVFGEAVAVLAGDALLSFAPQLIIEKSKNLSSETIIKVLYEYTQTAGAYGLIAGQVVDIESENKGIKNPEVLDFIHTHKTADLFRLSLKAGAIIAGADNNALEEMGKTVGKDKNSNKLTYVSLYGLEKAEEKLNILFNEVYDIINKYNSDIFKTIVDNMKKKLEKNGG